MATTTKNYITIPKLAAEEILKELRLLREEISLILPSEDLKDYAHSRRIRRSYQKAMKKYPPLSSWK